MNLYRHRGRIYSLLRAYSYEEVRIGPGAVNYNNIPHKHKTVECHGKTGKRYKQNTYMDIDHENYSNDLYCYSRGKSFAKFLSTYRQCL